MLYIKILFVIVDSKSEVLSLTPSNEVNECTVNELVQC